MDGVEGLTAAGMPEARGSASSEAGMRELSRKVLVYFRGFLEHDFKRQMAPRRRIRTKTDAGYRCAIDLRKYSAMFQDGWSFAGKPSGDAEMRIGRRKYRAAISPVLRNMVEQYAMSISAQSVEDVKEEVLRVAVDSRAKGQENPQEYAEQLIDALSEHTARKIVHPILQFLEGPFKEAAYSVEESIFEIEGELTEGMCAEASEHIPIAANTYIIKGETADLKAVLDEFMVVDWIKTRVIEFFGEFAAADAHQEVRDLMNYCRSEDSLSTYMYFGAVRFGTNDFPVFMMPVNIEQADDGAYRVRGDCRLLVNKEALDWVAGEMRTSAQRVKTSEIADRIIHLKQEEPAIERMASVMLKLAPMLDVPGDIDVWVPKAQSTSSAQIRLSNAVYLAVFDKSEEGILSDYESMLSSLDADHVEAARLFEDIVKSIMFEDPVSVSSAVRGEWEQRTPEDRMVIRSPIPLNEEQAQIEIALAKPECRFVSVSGPPGTGKSHAISSLAFNSILDGKTVLIVSDKTEALDVVQDKLEGALANVRSGEDFPNPILRLGREGGTYRGLISGAVKSRIETHHKAQSADIDRIRQEIEEESASLKDRIKRTVQTLGDVELKDVARLQQLEGLLDRDKRMWAERLSWVSTGAQSVELDAGMNQCTEEAISAVTQGIASQGLSDLEEQLRVQCCAIKARKTMLQQDGEKGIEALKLFTALEWTALDDLLKTISDVNWLRRPLVGLLMRGRELTELDRQLAAKVMSKAPMGMTRRVNELKLATNCLAIIRSEMIGFALERKLHAQVFSLVSGQATPCAGAQQAWQLVKATRELLVEAGVSFEQEALGTGQSLELCRTVAQYMKLNDAVRRSFNSVPQMDYGVDKSRLESLHAAVLAHEIDGRFLRFVDEKRATAKTLGSMIKNKERFPVDQFEHLSEAFPCVIAGIREVGEYVPMKKEVFDLVIIDEASQVSVAQALPAILRGRKICVFGDMRQFSSTKAHNASNAINAAYLSDIEAHCRSRVTTAADKLSRLRRFDVKKSILEFVELVANHQAMLRKHFRGTQETISFCAKHFYGGQLQAIKIRGVPIEEVIRFEYVDAEAAEQSGKNINRAEGERILAMLKGMLREDGKSQTVAVITPLREQQAYLSGLLFNDADGERFAKELRLKVATFDAIQGEERDVCVYSMVATRSRDVLQYIFPVELKGGGEEAEEALKVQRINVGFSRTKEVMVFVLSKPIAEFKGTARMVLQHYENLLRDKSVASAEDTDPSSPMEKKVLEWLQLTPFFNEYADELEVMAQFPIGDYLRQLNVNYKHPAYRVDFLIRHYSEDGTTTNAVIEYDGFEAHWDSRQDVNKTNWERYCKPEDIERQLTLEAYGYRFIRLNRFNLGKDPVSTLDKRLREVIKVSASTATHAAVEEMREKAQALSDGSARQCSRCKTIKAMDSFFDQDLGGGRGGHGRVCTDCKRKDRPAFKVSRRSWYQYGARR